MGWIRSTVMLALALTTFAFLPAQPAGRVAASGPATASRTAQGIRVSLSLPRSVYPRNGLVRASFTVRNTTTRDGCVFAGGPPNPNGFTPFVDVFDDQGRVIPTSILDLFVWYPGPAPVPLRLLPHRQITFRSYVVLRGSGLQSSITFRSGWPCQGTRRTIPTPILHLALTPPDTPSVQLTMQGDRLVAALHYPDIAAHSLRYVDAAKCGTDFLDVAQNPVWVRVKALDVAAGCPNPLAWRAVIGTLNHSVAWINYAKGA